jgi:hypothetical protein
MDGSASLLTAFSIYFTQLPLYLVWLVGIGLAIARWERQPRVSLFTLIALAILLVTSVVSAYISVQMTVSFVEWGWSSAKIGIFFTVYRIIHAMLETIAFVLLLIAIFGWPQALPESGS